MSLVLDRSSVEMSLPSQSCADAGGQRGAPASSIPGTEGSVTLL